MQVFLGFIIVVLVLALVFLFVLRDSLLQKSRDTMDRLANKVNLGKQIASLGGMTMEYLGGHPYHPNPSKAAIISIRERGFVISAGGRASALSYAHLKDVQFMSHEQVSRDVTLTRLVTLGLLAFAAKKKTVTTERFLKMTVELGGIQNQVLFKTPDAGRIAGLLNQGRVNAAYTSVPRK